MGYENCMFFDESFPEYLLQNLAVFSYNLIFMSEQCFLLSNSSSLYCSIQLCEGGTVTDLAKNVTIRGRKIDEIMISYIMRDTARVSLASITIFSEKVIRCV